ncbi:MAG: flagellar basal body-associated protein FliL [Janthinobacterium lividum]
MATAPKTAKTAPKAAAPAEEVVVPVKSKKKLVMIAGLVAVLAIGGGAAWWFLGRAKPDASAHEEVKHAPVAPPVFAVLEPFTVNLQPENGDQYLQVAITLQASDAHKVDELKSYTPVLRGRLLVLLSSKKASEINTAEGKKKLVAEILNAVNEPYVPGGPKGDVNGVFLTSFVIQ